MEKFNFDYESESDDLFIYSEGKKSAGAVEFGSFILDFDDKHNLVAIQIMNVSEVLAKILSKMVEVSKIKEIKAEIVNFRDMDAIKFSISDGKVKEKANILIPRIREKSPVLIY